MPPPARLEETVAPGELIYALHHSWDESTEAARQKLRRRLEMALVTCDLTNTAYVADVATVWACLYTGSACRPKELRPLCTPDTVARSTLEMVALAIQSGATAIEQLSYLRYMLCRKHAPSMMWATLAPPTNRVGAPEYRNLLRLLAGFSRDCTFAATGDWMVHTRAALLCPPWRACVTEGGEPPFKAASSIHGQELNQLLRPAIDRPIHEQLDTLGAQDDTIDAFVVIYTLLQELIPNTHVAVNSDILRYAGTPHPIPFICHGMTLPKVVRGDCHGLLVGRSMVIFNGCGVLQAAAAWIYLLRLTAAPGATDVAGFVLDGAAVSDGNPLLKYRTAK